MSITLAKILFLKQISSVRYKDTVYSRH